MGGLGFFLTFDLKLQWVTGLRPQVGVLAEGTVASVSPCLCGGDWTQEEDGLAPSVLRHGALILGDVIFTFFGEDKYIIVDFGETLQLHILPWSHHCASQAGEGELLISS